MPEPDTPGHHQRRQDWSEFLHHRGADEPPHHRARTELIQCDARLQRQNHARECAGQKHHGQRTQSDAFELFDDVSKVDRPGRQTARDLSEEFDVILHLEQRVLGGIHDSSGH